MLRSGQVDYLSDASQSAGLRRWEFMPHARWRRDLSSWAVGEAAFFMSAGEERRIYESVSSAAKLDTVTESKLGLGLDLVYGKSGRIGFYSTFDLDEIGKWDGGNIRGMFLFD